MLAPPTRIERRGPTRATVATHLLRAAGAISAASSATLQAGVCFRALNLGGPDARRDRRRSRRLPGSTQKRLGACYIDPPPSTAASERGILPPTTRPDKIHRDGDSANGVSITGGSVTCRGQRSSQHEPGSTQKQPRRSTVAHRPTRVVLPSLVLPDHSTE